MTAPTPPRLPPGERLRRLGIASWSLIGVLIVAGMAVWLLLKVRIIFPPLVLALLIIYLLNPLVTRLQRRGVPRAAGALLTYVVVLGGIGLAVMALIPVLTTQSQDLAEQWPRFRAEMVDSIQSGAAGVEDRFGVAVDTTQVVCLLGGQESSPAAPTDAECDEVVRELRRQISAQAGRITDISQTLLEGLLVFLIAPLIALYLLIDLPQIKRDVLGLVPEAHRDEALDLGSKIGRAMGGFFRGQLLVALSVGLLSAVGFALIGLPFWFVIGAVAGFFNLIPLVGPFVGGVLGFLVGVISGDLVLGLKAAAVELVVQQIDNHFISPMVMRRAVQIHPATVMLALLAGGALAGFWGVLLAVPAVAVAKLLAGHFWQTRILGVEVTPFVKRPGRGGPPPGAPPPADAAAPRPSAAPPPPPDTPAPRPPGAPPPPADASALQPPAASPRASKETR